MFYLPGMSAEQLELMLMVKTLEKIYQLQDQSAFPLCRVT